MSGNLIEGDRVGRFVVLLLPGGRLINVERPLSVLLAWFDGGRA